MYKPFKNLADVVAKCKANKKAIIDAKVQARIAKGLKTRAHNKKFREENIDKFLEQIKIYYCLEEDFVRVAYGSQGFNVEVWQYPYFLETNTYKSIYGAINYFWLTMTGSDINIGMKMYNVVIDNCGYMI